MRPKLATLPALALTALLARPAAAQVLIAPIQLFLDGRTPVGNFYVFNQSQKPAEVAISFRFGYPVTVTTAAGGMTMVYGDTLPLADRSMQNWVRAFPRQFVLAPGERQQVRVTAQPPAGLSDGMYWTRLVTSSTPQQPPIDSASPGVTARLTFRVEQVTTVLYRKGAVNTAVTADTPRVSLDSASVVVLAPLTRGGNAPFFGNARVQLLREDGTEATSSEVNFSLYAPLTERFEFDRSKLPPGSYVAELHVTAERPDIPATELLPIDPIVKRVAFKIP